ncbi:MAG: amidohydrolase [Candidatus Aegiribacteria sp.]
MLERVFIMGVDKKADTILYNGVFFTPGNESQDGCLAIRDGHIIYIGSEAGSKEFVNSETQFVDCQNNSVLPSFFDSHCHAFMGGRLMNSCLLLSGKNREDYFDLIKQYADQHKDKGFILGFGWCHMPFESIGPSKKDLDRLIPDRPAIFLSIDYHSAWVNSKALEIADIDENTSDPSGGHIEREPGSDEPHGCLREMPTIRLVTTKLSQPGKTEWKDALRDYMKRAAKNGITSIFDAGILNSEQEPGFSAAVEMDNEGELTIRMRLSHLCIPDLGKGQVPGLIEARQKYRSRNVNLNVAKIFMDGTIEGHTGFLLKPYEDRIGYRGKPVWDEENFKQTALELHKNGFQIHVHSISDGATRNTVDGLEYAQTEHKGQNLRHTLAHLELVDREDIKRFNKLGLVASIQPSRYYMDSDYFKETVPLLSGERANERYLLEDFKRDKADIAFGSDWPWGTVSSSMDPFKAIGTAVIRSKMKNDSINEYELNDEVDNPYEPGERIDLRSAIEYHTIGGAYQNFIEDTTGTIETGKKADLVILNEDVFSKRDKSQKDTEVVMTLFEGRIVYEK